jgi:hypothetical protein
VDRVGEGFGQIREKRRKFLKAVYDLAHGHPTAHVNKADVALRLGMDVGDRASDYRGSQKSSFVLCSAYCAMGRIYRTTYLYPYEFAQRVLRELLDELYDDL